MYVIWNNATGGNSKELPHRRHGPRRNQLCFLHSPSPLERRLEGIWKTGKKSLKGNDALFVKKRIQRFEKISIKHPKLKKNKRDECEKCHPSISGGKSKIWNIFGPTERSWFQVREMETMDMDLLASRKEMESFSLEDLIHLYDTSSGRWDSYSQFDHCIGVVLHFSDF